MPRSNFGAQLEDRQPQAHDQDRLWIYVPYDQLTDEIGWLSRQAPEELGIVLVECPAKARRRPYHKQKLALVLANSRNFALEQAARGVAVRHVVSEQSFAAAIQDVASDLGPLHCMEPAERELRVELAPLVADGALNYSEHEGFLTSPSQFSTAHPKGPPWRMDRFYRTVRKDTGILMENGKPVGGKLSFDGDNRAPWKGSPLPPAVPTFEPNEVTLEVVELIESHFPDHPGQLHPQLLPATQADARQLWTWAKETCLEHFGPYQDAMASDHASLFHTRISSLLHLHRLLPRVVLEDVLELDIPLGSKEGFVRQVLGWREFVRHVHRETDGFRELATKTELHEGTDDAGYAQWRGLPEPSTELRTPEFRSAAPAFFTTPRMPLPAAFWGTPSGLECLDRVVSDVWDEGYGHHITRLMVLSNIATLLDVSPRELTDWFWVAYTDAYDWVVEPNVLGMGTFAAGDVMTTKPYVAGSAYIDRMSDYCGNCEFNPKKNCPIRSLYWAFLDRHREPLAETKRLTMPLASLRKRGEEQRAADQAVFEWVREALEKGTRLTPDSIEGGA